MLKALSAVLSLISLAVSIAAPFLYFWNQLTDAGYKNLLLAASLAWFVFATWWAVQREKG